MVSKAKLYLQLDHLEDELRERIIPHLENAAIGENDLVFCATDFNSFSELKFKTDTETDSLIQLGRQILALRGKLGEPSTRSIAERICWYCRKWGDTDDDHRKATQGLAREFLDEIANAAAKNSQR
jgi:hypothetical protein